MVANATPAVVQVAIHAATNKKCCFIKKAVIDVQLASNLCTEAARDALLAVRSMECPSALISASTMFYAKDAFEKVEGNDKMVKLKPAEPREDDSSSSEEDEPSLDRTPGLSLAAMANEICQKMSGVRFFACFCSTSVAAVVSFPVCRVARCDIGAV